MPRKAFIADLQEAIHEFRSECFSDLKAGEEDGTITFRYHEHNAAESTLIQAIIPGKSPHNLHPFSLSQD